MTMTFTATFGLAPGYGQHTAVAALDWPSVAEIIHQEIDYVRELSGVIVGCIAHEASVFYPREFGCPPTGERVLLVSGAHNPFFVGADSWRESVETFVERLKERLRQERVTLTFSPAETIYLQPDMAQTEMRPAQAAADD